MCTADTCPQRAEGITACQWVPFEDAVQMTSYANAREVLRRANDMVSAAFPRPATDDLAATGGADEREPDRGLRIAD